MKTNEQTFIKLSNDILRRKDITPTEKLLIAYLQSFQVNNKVCYQTEEEIAEELGMSVRTIKRTVKKLVDNNVCKKEKASLYSGKRQYKNRKAIIVITPSDTQNTLNIVNNKIKKREIKMETPKFNVNEFIKNSDYYNTIDESRREGMLKYFLTFSSEEDVVAEIKKLQQKEAKKQLKLKNDTITPAVEESVVNEPKTADDMIIFLKEKSKEEEITIKELVVEEVKENTPTKQVEQVKETIETSTNEVEEVKKYLNIEIRGYKGLKYIVDEMAQYIVSNYIDVIKMDKMELITLANQFNVL